MITKEDLQAKFNDFAVAFQADPKNAEKAYNSLLSFLMSNSCNMNEEAQEILDKFLTDMKEALRNEMLSMPDSPEKDLLERRLRAQNEDYPSVLKLRMDLGGEQPIASQLLRDSISVFDSILQEAIDHIMDVSKTTHSGPAGFAQYSLFISSVNEQLVASHLIQKQYFNQAYTHIRTVMENMDKIKLFNIHPEMAAKWTGDDRESHWRAFMPAKVRKALGNPGYDPIYGFFSKLGPHGTFDGVRLISGKLVSTQAIRPRLKFWLGRSPWEDQIVFSLGFLLHNAFTFLELVTEVYSKLLPMKLQSICRDNALKSIVSFHENNMVPEIKKLGFDVRELEEWLICIKQLIKKNEVVNDQ
jgi:hypothetical protein